MAKISGKWTFNNALTLVSQMWYFDYSYGGTECYSMYISGGSLWYCTENIGEVQVYMEGPGWLGNYKTIDFGETEQTVDDSFYEWFTANAIQVLTLAEKLTTIANNEQKVYDAGVAKGLNKGGYADGVEAGKKAEYDAFWDNFQDGGKRTDYTYAFSRTWFDEIFKPKHSIVPTNADHMFFGGKMTAEGFKAAIENGVTFDFSKATMMAYAFSSMANLVEIPFDVSLEGATSANNTNGAFSYNAQLETIKKIILKGDGSNPLDPKMFASSPKIKNIAFEGIIANSLNMGHCTQLTADSIKSIISHLSDTAEGKSLTLSQEAVDNAKFDSTVSVPAGCISGGGSLYSNPIYVKSGQRLKVELIVDDDHFKFPNTPTVYDDPQWWKVGLISPWDHQWNPTYRSYIYAPIYDDNHTVNVYFEQYTIDSSTQPARFSVRAVFVDENDNEIPGENLFSAVEVYGIENIDGWEVLRDSKPNWTISTQ